MTCHRSRLLHRLGELCRPATDTSDCRGFCRCRYLSLFVVCRYLSTIELSTIFGTTASRAFRAVSRETPYFAASSFSGIFCNSLSCEKSRLIASLTCSSFFGLGPRRLPACRRSAAVPSPHSAMVPIPNSRKHNGTLAAAHAKRAAGRKANSYPTSTPRRLPLWPELACNGMPALIKQTAKIIRREYASMEKIAQPVSVWVRRSAACCRNPSEWLPAQGTRQRSTGVSALSLVEPVNFSLVRRAS